MYRIKEIEFNKHPVLGNLKLDFCNLAGEAVDTVIIAGENGCGKSTILNDLYSALNYEAKSEISITFDMDGKEIKLDYQWEYIGASKLMCVNDHRGLDTTQYSSLVKSKYDFNCIFSDVDINFTGGSIQTVTSSELDTNALNRKSSPDLPTQIKQLIVDVQNSDDADTADSYRKVIEKSGQISDIICGSRMQRFTNAFNAMFENLSYSKVENIDNRKSILFKKYGKEIEIDLLSSGEKQIVYRGCFLLRDKNSLSGAFAFVDEPEISLHPEWQKKVMSYYKGIFTNSDGIQTSQLFVVTHSPFIIHSSERKNDKVIVLKRDADGNIVSIDRPEYYMSDSMVAIHDAFNVSDFSADTSKITVYVEGRTDELYFNKAKEIYGFGDYPLDIQWVGHMTSKGKEEFSGSPSLNYAVQFMKGRKPKVPQVFVYDSDTNKEESFDNNVMVLLIPKYHNTKGMNKGIENALCLEKLDLEPFYETRTMHADYGGSTTTVEFQKMRLAKYVCGLDELKQKEILINLKPILEKIVDTILPDNK